ncbi:MAG: trypsin-like peptidase domain-containing protein [Desulfocapsaceae bacterium]|nr:trypsin-like peptidase domain-containing protein [Desulfocapsaceae bacterium]
MKCPKCNHIQADSTECRKCGVIFAKYEAYEKRKRELENKGQKKSGTNSNAVKFGLAFLLIIATAGLTYYFTSMKYSASDQQTAMATQQKRGQVYDVPKKQAEVKADRIDIPKDSHVDTQQLTSGSPVDKARRATVSIETPWGTGSGFFIRKNYIVTNRHVVEFDDQNLKETKEKITTRRKLIDLEQEKLANLRSQMRRMAEGPTKSQLRIVIAEREKILAKYIDQQQESERKLAELEKSLAAPEIKIILDNGQEHFAGFVLTSQNYDLALLALFSHDGSHLKTAPNDVVLRQGDKVFTVGSPVGLRQTVTSGVFSGFSRYGKDRRMYLQTDAAINPGNSGGPLIDEQGYVRGVNTMIIRDTEGIGFAIPIEKVYQEFGTTLQ